AEVIAGAIAEEHLDDLERAGRISLSLGRAGFTDGSVRTETLSGGWRRRLAIARELARQPDLLFLDEPTNHLDLEGILWLERLIATEPAAFLVVSHDRWFLEHVVRRVLELDPVHAGGFFETRGSYSDFLERKDAALREQAR